MDGRPVGWHCLEKVREYDVTSRWLTDRSIVWPSVSQKPGEGFF